MAAMGHHRYAKTKFLKTINKNKLWWKETCTVKKF